MTYWESKGYEVVIGLEVHAQLSTKSKMYCGDPVEYGTIPNSLTSPISLGLPGTLPKINREAINYAIKMGLACHTSIERINGFARKNYFYPDLPKGYQVTQDKTPICYNGHLDIVTEQGSSKRIGIQRIHLEEDAGKSIHDIDPYNSLVDLNRAGTALIEIVTDPDLRSPEEAQAYLREIRKMVRYLDICDGNMEEGSLRCDANISVRKIGSTEYGQRVEVKNMNSIRHVMKAIEYEATRQIDEIEAGNAIAQETRSFNATDHSTFALRSKEDSMDYRYFPEPDLIPIHVSDEDIEAIKKAMPELPRESIPRLMETYGLSMYDAQLLTEDRNFAHFANGILEQSPDAKIAVNLLIGPVRSWMNEMGQPISAYPLSAAILLEVIELLANNLISFSSASQKLIPHLQKHPQEAASEASKALGIIQNNDEKYLEALIDGVLAENQDKVKAYKQGKTGLLGMFMGQIMKKSGGKADPKQTSILLREKLS